MEENCVIILFTEKNLNSYSCVLYLILRISGGFSQLKDFLKGK